MQDPDIQIIVFAAGHRLIAADFQNGAPLVHDRHIIKRLPSPCVFLYSFIIAGNKSPADRLCRVLREFKNVSADYRQPVIFSKLLQLPFAPVQDGDIIRVHFCDQFIFAMSKADIQCCPGANILRKADKMKYGRILRKMPFQNRIQLCCQRPIAYNYKVVRSDGLIQHALNGCIKICRFFFCIHRH